jgi:hypothetical protein
MGLLGYQIFFQAPHVETLKIVIERELHRAIPEQCQPPTVIDNLIVSMNL